MRIRPKNADLIGWSKQIPTSGDLIFFDEASKSLAGEIKFPLLTTDEVRAQSLEIWKLSDRSWYGYALNRTKFASYLPSGSLESLDLKSIRRLGRSQARLGVPSLILSSHLADGIKSRLIEVGRFRWITSSAFQSFDVASRVAVMKAWLIQNEIHFYSSVSSKSLSRRPTELLKSTGLYKVLNKYVRHSGPNCMAAAAAAISSNPKLASQWLHWAPLESFLKERGYRSVRSSEPQPGDVLVFSRGDSVVHSAFFVGDGLYFEKPGQDFYEPYRLEHFDRWKSEWPTAKLSILRKKDE